MCGIYRLKPDKKKRLAEDIKELDNNIHIIRAPQQVSEKIKVDVAIKKSVQNEAMEEWFCENIMIHLEATLYEAVVILKKKAYFSRSYHLYFEVFKKKVLFFFVLIKWL